MGVVRTRVGYTGGSTKNPTYHTLGDHTETVQIDYDPTQISFEELLDIFWDSHRPAQRAWSRQYMAAVFFHNERLQQLALASRERETDKRKGRIHTQILPASVFYLAEDYHQKYRLRHERGLMREFEAIYPAPEDFIDSTAAARVNGFVSGFGTLTQLRTELPQLGLSPAADQKLLDMVSGQGR